MWNWGVVVRVFFGRANNYWNLLSNVLLPHETLGFRLVAELGLDINSGLFFRYLHANGASVFFFYVRIFILQRGCITGGYLKRKVWWTGIVIYLVMVATAFWGMSCLEDKCLLGGCSYY